MAAKKQTKSKTRTAAKKQGFQFKWWMAGVVVAIIFIVGIAIIRFSNASSTTLPSYTIKTTANAYGLIRYMQYDQGKEAGEHTARAKPDVYGRYQKYDGNIGHNICLKPIGTVKNSGPITKVGAYNNVQEEPCA